MSIPTEKQVQEVRESMERIVNNKSRGVVLVCEISAQTHDKAEDKKMSAGVMYLNARNSSPVEFLETMIGAIQTELGIDRLGIVEWIVHTYKKPAATYSAFPHSGHKDIGLSGAAPDAK